MTSQKVEKIIADREQAIRDEFDTFQEINYCVGAAMLGDGIRKHMIGLKEQLAAFHIIRKIRGGSVEIV